MHTLFENALTSIQLGIEDFRSGDNRRVLSSIRNIYAGVLLLAKEKLVQLAPKDDPDLLISKKIVAVRRTDGTVGFKSSQRQTLDRQHLLERLIELDVKIDSKALDDLAKVRNEIEHKFPSQPQEALREAIAQAFPLIVNLLRDHLGADPADVLGDAWTVMLETRDLYERELAACHEALSKIKWVSHFVKAEGLVCPECGSKLVGQEDPENDSQEDMVLSCRACGVLLPVEDTIVVTLRAALEYETYQMKKDIGEDGPIHVCPGCSNESYVDLEGGGCAICEYEIDERNCARCGTPMNVEEISYGNGSMCSWCNHMYEKLMRE